jgi:uncharacterized protein (DUF952 family)
MALIYKIIAAKTWREALAQDHFAGADIDLKDGYIHFSTVKQVEETARLHFAGQADLLLVAYEEAIFGPSLKWEASRGGQLFPHVYAALRPSQAIWAKPLIWKAGAFVFPPDFFT